MPSESSWPFFDYQQIKLFVTVAQSKSISGAAKELYLSQQALSKSIQNLEHELGINLFTRTARGTDLTNAGAKLLPIAQTLLEQYDFYSKVIADIVKTERQSISVAFEHVYLTLAMPAELLARASGITMKSLVAGSIENCVELVSSGRADIGFTSLPDDLGGLSYASVLTEPVMFLMNTHNQLARKSALTLNDLRNADHARPLGTIRILDQYISECLKVGFYPRFAFEASDFEQLVRNVQANDLVQLTASFALAGHSSDGLVLRPLEHETLSAEYGFVYREGDLTLSAKSFMNAVLSFYDHDQVF